MQPRSIREAKREREKKYWPWRHILKQPNRNYIHICSFKNEATTKRQIDGMMCERERERKEVKLMHFRRKKKVVIVYLVSAFMNKSSRKFTSEYCMCMFWMLKAFTICSLVSLRGCTIKSRHDPLEEVQERQ